MNQEIIFFIFGTAILLIYHLFLYYNITYLPLTTTIGQTRQMRAKWVEIVMHGQKDLLAVQTLRNWTMSASFLASTAIVIGLGILNFILTTERFLNSPQIIDLTVISHENLWIIKLILLSTDFFLIFFNFTLTIRSYNQASILLSIPPSDTLSIVTVVKIINRGANYYTFGMRGYYIAIPLVLNLFGAQWFLIGSSLLALLLLHIDYES